MNMCYTWGCEMRKPFFSFLIVMLAAGTVTTTALAQGRFRGVVVGPEGNPIEGATVVAEKPDANPPRFEQQSDTEGRFSMVGLASGSWTLTAEVEGYHPNSMQVRITQSENPSATLEMARIKHPLVLMLGDEAFVGLDPDQIGQDLAAGDDAYRNSRWQVAIDSYTSILERLPMMNALNMRIGNGQRELENYDEAIAAYERAAAGDSSLTQEVETTIGRIRMLMGDFDAAGDALAAAASGGGATREDLYNLGELEFAKGEVDAAAEWYEKAVAADPNWVKPMFKLGLVALNKGDIETAKTFFAQVVEKDPSSEEGAQAQATLDALP